MRNKEKARQYNLLYRQMHRVAIRIKKRLYRRLPHIRKRIQRQRRKYYHEYYLRHRDKFIEETRKWAEANKDKRRLICKRYKEKLKQKRLDNMQKIKRIVEEFIEYCKDRYKKDTIRQYKKNMERFLKYIEKPGIRCKEYYARRHQELKKLPEKRDFSWTKEYHKILFIKDIHRELIMNYVSYINYDEINGKGLKLNQSEKETRLYPLKSFLLYCYRKGYIKKDLRKFIIIPSREKKVPKRVLTVTEMEKLLEAPNVNASLGIRDRALLELSYSGLRAEEILTLKPEHIDVVANSVTILDGKGDKDRVIPMTSEAIYWIKRWLNRRGEFIKDGNDPGYLFITKGKKPIIRRSFSKMVKRYTKKANILLDISPHDLRRATATHLVENGAPIRLIQALLGHASLKVTTKYLRLSNEKIKKEHKETHPSHRRSLYYGNL